MKALLATSPNPALVKIWVCQETSPAGSLLPPTDLASIAALLRERGDEPRIADLRLHDDPLAFWREEIASFNPDVVVMNLTTTGATDDMAVIDATPSNIPFILFGTHAQAEPEECFARGARFILVGDPEIALAGLLRQWDSPEKAPGVLSPGRTEGIAPALADDLSTLPFPALDLLPMERYHSPIVRRGNRFTILLGSRGCPFPCTFCLYPALFGRRYRTRTPENVAEEMAFNLERHGVRESYFLDATFNLTEERVNAVCEAILARGLKVSWSCNLRVHPVSAAMLALMRRAGCRMVFYGVEDQDFLEETRKGTDRNQTEQAFALTREAGILSVAFLMLFPGRKLTESAYVEQTMATLSRLKADAFQLNVAIPFPGVEDYRDARAAGLPDTPWRRFDPHGEGLGGEEYAHIHRVRRAVYRRFVMTHPVRTVQMAMAMDPRALMAAAATFVKSNLLPLPRGE